MIDIGPPFGNEYKFKEPIKSSRNSALASSIASAHKLEIKQTFDKNNNDGYFINHEKGYMVRAKNLMISLKDC